MKMVYGSQLDNFDENLTVDVIKTHIHIQFTPKTRRLRGMDPIANNVDPKKVQNIL